MTKQNRKTRSIFLPPKLRERAQHHVEAGGWQAQWADAIELSAQPWLQMSDDELWSLMFGSTLPRSWHVLSDGRCPACQKSVPMYNWRIDPLIHPWKVICPHCESAFPTNDFKAYDDSGLDSAGIFQKNLADKSLLYNIEHPEADDPKRKWGVDDGWGWSDGDRTWRFIGAFLIYGQWKKLVLAGIVRLTDAYVITGDNGCARKAMILLDRIADLYPTFNFGREGILYERQGDRGYVSTWHDACEETRLLALAYDAIFEAAREDQKLVAFLRQKAEKFDIPNPKNNFEQIQDNIENRILRDVVQNRHKIDTNFPGAETCCAVIRSVLEWHEKRDDILREMDPVIEEATCTDSVTGEKGLPAYGSYVIRKLATWLQRYERIEPGFIREMLERHPALRNTWRFHIDTWCMQKYYPTCGDALAFARPSPQYLGVNLSRPDLQPDHGYSARALGVSPFTFLWRLYETTGDPAYAQIMWLANGQTTDNLPWDVYAEDVAEVPGAIEALIRREGSRIYPGSIDMKQWHLALLRTGRGSREHVAWIDYDSAGNHGHQDAMNVGLYAFGLDLMPDFGYPPVQFGGWNSERANWYRKTAAHNTVVVDGQDQIGARQRAEGRGGIGGETTLQAHGRWIRAVRIEAANQYEQTSRYERTLAMVEINEDAFCLLDIFRIAGGQDHALFRHSHFARIQTDGLGLEPAEDYGRDTIMRGFQTDPNPDPGWSVTWNVEDRYGLSNTSEKVVLRHIGLTTDAKVSLCEGWIIEGGYDKNEEAWIPRLMVRRRAAEPSLSSTFVSVVEVHEGKPAMSQVHRLAVRGADGCEMGDSSVAVEVKLRDGRRDLLVFLDAQEKTEAKVTWNSTDITLEGEACWLRRSGAGAVTHAALMRGRELHAGEFELIAAHDSDLTELTPGT